jgi:hypothetical protein
MVRQYVGAAKFISNLLKGDKQKTTGTEVIKSFKPAVGKSKIAKAIDDVKLTALQAKGRMKKQSQDFDRDIQKVKSKLGQTSQKLKGEPVTESGFSKGRDLKKVENKAKGGRIGYKRGTGLMKKKSDVQKIKETFGPRQSKAKKKFPDLTGDGKVTFADILKGRGVINGKKKKKVI